MNRIFIALALIFVLGCSRVDSRGINGKNPVGAGKELRTMILTTTPQSLGFDADQDYAKVYGVLTDWNIDEQTASIVSMKDGMASVYTTTAFGIIGGEGHDSVRKAAKRYVKIAGQYYDTSTPVSDFPYPSRGKVNFYLLTYDGVRLCIGDQAGIDKRTDPTRPLFAAAQDVLTELRIVTENKSK
jgi:hypothetical protein